MSKQLQPQIRRLVEALDQLECPHRIVDPDAPEVQKWANWIETKFPFVHSHIDWSQVPSHVSESWHTIDDLVDQFGLMTQSLFGSDLVFVMWNDSLSPAIELSLGDVRRVSRDIFQVFESSIDCWIASNSQGWLVEMYHEGTLSMGRESCKPQEGQVLAW